MSVENQVIFPIDLDTQAKHWVISINHGQPFTLYQISFSLSFPNLFFRFAGSELFPKVFFQERDSSSQKMSLGSLIEYNTWPMITFLEGDEDKDDLEWFLLHPFFKDSKEHPLRCFVPLILLEKKDTLFYCRLYFDQRPSDADISERLSHLDTLHSLPNDPPLYHSSFRIDNPSKIFWKELIQKTTTEMNSTFKKVVLARQSIWTCQEIIDPYHLLLDMINKYSSCTIFGVIDNHTHAFLGATPENLYVRERDVIRTESLAGTRPRGKTPSEDLHLEKTLMTCFKDQEEFGYVRDWIEEKLRLLCSSFERNPSLIKKYPYFQHLYCGFNGLLKPEIDDRFLVLTLHPTPALAGFPQDSALKWIHQYESFPRGYYGAPLGFISSSRAYLAIGIRSAIINENRIEPFAGCGIVKDSTPQDEWDELETKTAPFKRYLC